MRGFFGLVGAVLVGFCVAFVGVITCPYMGKIVNRACCVENKCTCGDDCTCCKGCCKPAKKPAELVKPK